tara:strand:+ start:1173 stop:1544 length:372 start_codon:yes stop_codon:yes gene_type:complete
MRGPSLYRKSATPMKGDLDKDGKLSGYEANRQSKIDANSPAQQKKTSQEDFVPAFPGADISEEEYKKQMSKGAKKTTTKKPKKGKIIYKDGKKFYQAADGTLHTGQVSDYEKEKAIDEANKPK